MPSAKALGISIAAGLVIGSGGGSALDVIAIFAVSGVAMTTLITAFLRRSAPQAEVED